MYYSFLTYHSKSRHEGSRDGFEDKYPQYRHAKDDGVSNNILLMKEDKTDRRLMVKRRTKEEIRIVWNIKSIKDIKNQEEMVVQKERRNIQN